MKNQEIIKKYLVDKYNELSATHRYIFGFAIGGMVYAAKVEDGRNLLESITTISKMSTKSGGGYGLKYKANKNTWALITTYASTTKTICTTEYLEKLRTNSRHNRGQLFEELVQSVFGGELETKSNLKFTEGGDINIDNKPYQIKYVKATFTDERTIQNLMK